MSTSLQDQAVDSFLSSYREDLAFEELDDQNVVISFPVHFSGFHRVEVTITRVDPKRILLSDGAKVIDELRNAGYQMTSRLRERVQKISRFAEIRVVNDHLIAEASPENLGTSILRFVEAAKTIGDAYLVQRLPVPKDTNLLAAVSNFFAQQGTPFQTNRTLQGKIEKHPVDFLFPPNGVPGLAVKVIDNPAKVVAESWYFRAHDIRQHDERMRVGIVFDPDQVNERSQNIFDQSVDISVPSTKLPAMAEKMRQFGILKAGA